MTDEIVQCEQFDQQENNNEDKYQISPLKNSTKEWSTTKARHESISNKINEMINWLGQLTIIAFRLKKIILFLNK